MAYSFLCGALVGVAVSGTSTPLPESHIESSAEMHVPLMHVVLNPIDYVSSQQIEEVHPGPNHQIPETDTEHLDDCMIALRMKIVILMIAMIVLMRKYLSSSEVND
jgi:hypothetical protein